MRSIFGNKIDLLQFMSTVKNALLISLLFEWNPGTVKSIELLTMFFGCRISPTFFLPSSGNL